MNSPDLINQKNPMQKAAHSIVCHSRVDPATMRYEFCIESLGLPGSEAVAVPWAEPS